MSSCLGPLVSRAGGRERVLLVGECALPGGKPPSARPWMEALARELFAQEEAAPPPPPPPRPWPTFWPRCRLLLVLFRAASLRSPAKKERLRLRAILLDLRRRLRGGGFPAVVGVAVLTSPEEAGDPEGESARSALLALLRGVFRERKGAAAEETLQAALYDPGGGGGGAGQVQEAACKALSAALSIHADGVEIETQKLPFFLQCLPWGRRRQRRKGQLEADAKKVNEDASQDAEEVVALTSMAPNGNCEDPCGKAGI
ncbi:uncharacterized protein C2orf72 homolog [Anolis carolinensis]|uniref:uncharacterized protein C2orf72 homolog n=1 Tax=Anolis carolinensis TaxID=28377 RepID=UPI002F2B2E89